MYPCLVQRQGKKILVCISLTVAEDRARHLILCPHLGSAEAFLQVSTTSCPKEKNITMELVQRNMNSQVKSWTCCSQSFANDFNRIRTSVKFFLIFIFTEYGHSLSSRAQKYKQEEVRMILPLKYIWAGRQIPCC